MSILNSQSRNELPHTQVKSVVEAYYIVHSSVNEKQTFFSPQGKCFA